MDWFSWLLKTGLDPSLVYEYGLLFTHNELEEEDILYFNHEFLQSMGISTAKHRLEILKLARKENKKGSKRRSFATLVIALNKTKKCLGKYIRERIQRPEESSSALVVVPLNNVGRNYYGHGWKSLLMLKRKKKLAGHQGKRLLLTNGNENVVSGNRIDSFSNRHHKVYDYEDEAMIEDENNHWSNGGENIKWDTLFQDLKPT